MAARDRAAETRWALSAKALIAAHRQMVERAVDVGTPEQPVAQR